jgi:Inhibitor of Apoptosis domain
MPTILSKFADERVRLRTFAYYNGECDITKITECGFFLKDNRSEICCFHCGVSIFEFDKKTDFLTLHLKLNPKCEFLLGKLSRRQFRKLMKRSTYSKPETYFVREKAPFNRDFVDCYNRIESLKSVRTKYHSKNKIARAGFYYSPIYKSVITCFECGLNISIEEKDNPWKIHCSLSPRCRYLLMSKGFYYIQKYV